MLEIPNNQFLGKILTLLIGMYGVHVYGQFVLFDNKGFLISTFVALWFLLISVIFFVNPIQQVVNQSYKSWNKRLIILFICYFLVSSFFNYDKNLGLNISNFFTTILPGFLLGVIFYSDYDKMLFKIKCLKRLNSPKAVKKLFFLLGILSFLFITYQLYLFYLNKLSLTLSLITISNDYYQDLGDYFIIFYIGWLSIRDNYRKSLIEEKRSYFLFTLTAIFEIIVAVIFLQIISSNKAPLAILLIGFSYLLFSFPSKFIFRLHQFFSILVVFIIVFFLISTYVDEEALSSLRFFGEANSTGITQNSSVSSRLDQVVEIGLSQISNNLLFGDIGISDYMHSSIISIQTHLGVIGSILFWTFLIFQCYQVYFISKDNLLKSITLPIIIVSSISSVFWWFPLWFVLGSLFIRK